VEHNTFCVSVHFRNCEESAWEDVQVCSGEAQGHGEGRSVAGKGFAAGAGQTNSHYNVTDPNAMLCLR
jgi:hypothetical protein